MLKRLFIFLSTVIVLGIYGGIAFAGHEIILGQNGVRMSNTGTSIRISGSPSEKAKETELIECKEEGKKSDTHKELENKGMDKENEEDLKKPEESKEIKDSNQKKESENMKEVDVPEKEEVVKGKEYYKRFYE